MNDSKTCRELGQRQDGDPVGGWLVGFALVLTLCVTATCISLRGPDSLQKAFDAIGAGSYP